MIQAANRGGGDDNITAVLFAVGSGGEPDERTREYATAPDALPEPDDEDTLHPEDGVTLPPELLAQLEPAAHPDGDQRELRPDDTVVVPVSEIAAAAAARRGAGTGGRARGGARAAGARLGRDPRARRPDRRAHLVGARALRNRELFYLAVVGVLTGLGFASVYIARQSVVSWGSLGYALFFFGLYLAAHLVARFAAPNADPYLLPMAALLTAVGLTEIYRLGPSDAFKQGLWIVIGVGLFALALLRLRRDYRLLEQYKYIFGIGAIVLLYLPRVPGLGTTVNGARLWVEVGPLRFQPGELAKIFLIVFLAGYLREKREVLAQGRLEDLGPLLVIWGGCMLVLVATNDLGSGLLYFGIFLAMLYAATARLSYVLGGIVLFGREGSPRTRRSRTSTSASRSGCSRGPRSVSTVRKPAVSRSARTARATSS